MRFPSARLIGCAETVVPMADIELTVERLGRIKDPNGGPVLRRSALHADAGL